LRVALLCRSELALFFRSVPLLAVSSLHPLVRVQFFEALMQFSPAPARRAWQSFLDKLFSRCTRGRRQSILKGFLPQLEGLEDRTAPAVFNVNTLDDTLAASPNTLTGLDASNN
jgi:hypothetical protein